MNVTASLIALIVGLICPAVTSVISREHISVKARAALTTGIAGVSGALTGAVTSTPRGWDQWEQVLWTIGLAWVTAGVYYFTGYNQSPASVAKTVSARTKSFGFIGSATPNPDEGSVTISTGYAVSMFVVAVSVGLCLAAGAWGWALISGILLLVLVGLYLGAWSIAEIAAEQERTDSRL